MDCVGGNGDSCSSLSSDRRDHRSYTRTLDLQKALRFCRSRVRSSTRRQLTSRGQLSRLSSLVDNSSFVRHSMDWMQAWTRHALLMSSENLFFFAQKVKQQKNVACCPVRARRTRHKKMEMREGLKFLIRFRSCGVAKMSCTRSSTSSSFRFTLILSFFQPLRYFLSWSHFSFLPASVRAPFSRCSAPSSQHHPLASYSSPRHNFLCPPVGRLSCLWPMPACLSLTARAGSRQLLMKKCFSDHYTTMNRQSWELRSLRCCCLLSLFSSSKTYCPDPRPFRPPRHSRCAHRLHSRELQHQHRLPL